MTRPRPQLRPEARPEPGQEPRGAVPGPAALLLACALVAPGAGQARAQEAPPPPTAPATAPATAPRHGDGLPAMVPVSRMVAAQERIVALEARLSALEARVAALPTLPYAALPDGDGVLAASRGRGAPRLSGRWIGETVHAVQDADGARDAPPATTADPDPAAPDPVGPTPGGQDAAVPDAEGEADRRAPAPPVAVEAVARDETGQYGSRLSFEVGTTYAHYSDARINLSGFLALDAIFLGQISLDQITADILSADATVRYGLTDRLQFDANIPYLYRHSNFSSGGAGGNASGISEASRSGHGLGDVNVGASYRLLREGARRPDIVLNARVKAPTGRHPFGIELIEIDGSEGNLTVPAKLSTGSGVWGGSLGVSVLKTIDPMVVFGSATWFHNFRRRFADIDEAVGDQPGRVAIGDAFQWGAGVAFALNDRSSLSLSFTQRIIERTRLRRDGEEWQLIPGSQANVGLLNVGGTFALSDKVTLIATVSVGMTDDAPDMSLSVRLPFRF